jgi:hypothetical protein
MTDKEHELMIIMFTRQALYIKMLTDLLENKGIVQGDDLAAFSSVVITDPTNVSVFLRVNEQYEKSAQSIHLELPKLPPSL